MAATSLVPMAIALAAPFSITLAPAELLD